MSDYIDEIERIIKRNSFQLKHGQNVHYLRANAAVEEVARAVAERVRASARVCSWCHGSGLHPGPYDDVPTCDRCAGRGVTFGGEA